MTMVGVDSFSYHRWFGETNEWEEAVDAQWTYQDFLARSVQLGADAVSLQTVYLPVLNATLLDNLVGLISSAQLGLVVAWGHRNGLQDGNNPDKLVDALRTMRFAEELDCLVTRVVCGDYLSWNPEGGARRQRARRLRPALERIADQADKLGILVAIENHADFFMEDLVSLVDQIDSDRLGICFDMGNSLRVGEDPVAAAQLAASRVMMVQVRDLKVQPGSAGRPGAWWASVALGTGDLPVDGVLEVLTSKPQRLPWFVEVSNVLPGESEDAIVEQSLAYLRNWLGTSQRRIRAEVDREGAGPLSKNYGDDI